MKETVLVRYGEISLKSEPVREKFEEILVNNIHSKLENTPHEIIQERGRIFVDTQSSRKVAEKLSNTPGIVSTSPAKKTKSEIDKIKALAKDIAEKNFSYTGNFAIDARRTGGHRFSSKDVEEKVGSAILEVKPELEVELDCPEQKIYIEVREENSYLFIEKIPGIGGLPVGCQGKTVNPYIGDIINSTISSFLLLKRGSPVYPLLFELNEDLKKSIEFLKEIHPNIKIATIDGQEIDSKISKISPDDYEEIVRQKIFLEISEKIANKIDGEALISDKVPGRTGLNKIRLIEGEITLPVLHPLTGFNEGSGKEIENRVKNRLDREHVDNRENISGETVKQEKVNKLMEQIKNDISYKSIYESLSIQKAEEIEWT